MAVDVVRLGERIRTLRDLRGLEQEDLADLAGLSQTYVSRLERGLIPNPKVYDLAALTRALGAELTDVLSPGSERASFIDRLMAKPELTMIFGRLVSGLDQADPIDQDFVLRGLQAYADRFGAKPANQAC